MPLKIGELLIKYGLITKEQLEEALKKQKEWGKRLGSTLVELGYITEKQLVEVLAKQLGVPAIDLSDAKIPEEVLKLLPAEICYHYEVLPLARKANILFLAMVDPSNIQALENVKFITGLDVEPVIAAESSLRRTLEKFYPDYKKEITKIEETKEKEEEEVIPLDIEGIDVEEYEELVDEKEILKLGKDTHITKLVNKIIKDAIFRKASDIHIEPFENVLRIRFRIDGVLQVYADLPKRLSAGIASRLKLMCNPNLDISERRKPQDGRIQLKLKDENDREKVVDFRVSVVPTISGEKVVMRILDKSGLSLDLSVLGFEENDLQRFLKAINSPYGIILVTGPTGSGKTTTLYSALSAINTPDKQIITIEDPVEYNIEGINQVQVNREVGLDFASALRAFLRQSPDVILVGEIRDSETAEIAIRAALTGHLVFSTIHTNDAPTTIDRLIDLGIQPYLIASSVILIQAQRLVRRICKNCKREVSYDPELIVELGIPKDEISTIKFFKGEGCEVCNYTGYKGRIGIYEVMPISPRIREMILNNATSDKIREVAREEGMHTLREDGIIKIKKGITTVEEVLRVTAAGEE
ncbi:MAG: type IV-A pilus assembly ATPase PilB [Candidatus Hydrothermales bacterium]